MPNTKRTSGRFRGSKKKRSSRKSQLNRFLGGEGGILRLSKSLSFHNGRALAAVLGVFVVCVTAAAFSSTAAATPEIKSGLVNKCLDNYQNRGINGNKVDSFTCNGTGAQRWVVGAGGTIEVDGKCLDVYQAKTDNGAKLDLYTCNGGKNQQWSYSKRNELVSAASGKCLDVPGASTVNGTQLQIWTCLGNVQQKWYLGHFTALPAPTGTPVQTTPVPTVSSAPSPTGTPAGSGFGGTKTAPASMGTPAGSGAGGTTAANGLSMSLYVPAGTDAANQAAAWGSSDPSGAAQMRKIATQPTAVWLGGWLSNVQQAAASTASAAADLHAMPVLVAYNIPYRDCGGYSSGGETDATYAGWIQQVAAGIGANPAIVIVEPDALAGISCLSNAEQQTRLSLIRDAVATLKQHSGVKVYLDAGNPGWQSAATIAATLNQANIAGADGFSLNVSNFYTTAQNISYGQQVSALVGGKHFVIDTSRNGNGSNGQWCNPTGRALGNRPTLSTGTPGVDAFLWIKYPGKSDGQCNGGPAAGTWWPSYALGLAQNAAF